MYCDPKNFVVETGDVTIFLEKVLFVLLMQTSIFDSLIMTIVCGMK